MSSFVPDRSVAEANIPALLTLLSLQTQGVLKMLSWCCESGPGRKTFKVAATLGVTYNLETLDTPIKGAVVVNP